MKPRGFIPIVIAILISVMAIGFVGAAWYFESHRQCGRNTQCAIQPTITNFVQCAQIGYPVTGTYPRQCSAYGKTFTEVITNSNTNVNSISNTNSVENGNTHTTSASDKLFVATKSSGNKLDIYQYDTVSNQAVQTKTILASSPDLITSSSGGWGANQAVQYDNNTGDIYYITKGSSDYDGRCINDDKTCLNRLYKINSNSDSIIKLWESSDVPTNWIVSPSNNVVLLSMYHANNEQILYRVDMSTGKTEKVVDIQHSKNTSLARFQLSSDQKYIYQMSKISPDGKALNETLALNKIQIESGKLETVKVFLGNSIEYNTSLSPDENRIAFFTDVPNKGDRLLYVHDFTTMENTLIPVEGKVKNLNLLWSGDSDKLWNILSDTVGYYSFIDKQYTVILPKVSVNYSFIWSPSARYILNLVGEELELYDSSKNIFSKLNLSIDHSSTVVGVDWI